MRGVHVVTPGDIDDPALPSGGNTYDRRVCTGLSRAGWSVREHAIDGSWPRADSTARAALTRSLSRVPAGSAVLLDGLVACSAPDIMCRAARRVRPVVLVHLPLADEGGLPPGEAAVRDERERRTLHAAAAVVATSTWTAQRLIDRHGIPTHRLHVATPGVDPAPLATATEEGSRLLCVAAVTPLKAQEVLVDALATLTGLPWRCRFVGSVRRAPRYAERVRRAVRAYGLGGRVAVAGPRTGARLAAAYAAADLLVLASRTEAYGMVLTEALARGIPVVATDVGGVREAVGTAPDGALPAMLVPPDDPAALAAAVRRWLADPGTRHRLRRAARARRATLAGWDDTVRAVAGALDASHPAATGRVG